MTEAKPMRYPPLWLQVTFFVVAVSLGAIVYMRVATHNDLFWRSWWVWILPSCAAAWVPVMLREIWIAWRSRDLRCRIEDLTFDRESGTLTARVLVFSDSGQPWHTERADIVATMIGGDTMAIPKRVAGAQTEVNATSGVTTANAVLPSDWDHGAIFVKVAGRRAGSRGNVRCQFPLVKW